jgi:hypothetical protein
MIAALVLLARSPFRERSGAGHQRARSGGAVAVPAQAPVRTPFRPRPP